MELPDRGQAKSWSGWRVLDQSGGSLGRCAGVFADTDTGLVEWLLVDVEGHRRCFVPAVDSVEEADTVRLPFSREHVLSAPDVGDAEQLAKSDEIELYRHYDLPWSDGSSDSLLPDPAVVADATESEPAPAFAPEPFVPAEPEPEPEPFVPAEPEPEPFVPAEPEPEPRVPAVAVVPAASPYRPQVTQLEALAPVAATGAGVVALWLLLRGLERRASRRRSPSVRSREAGRRFAAAAAEMSRQTASEVGDSATRASKAAQEHQRAAAKTAAKRRKAAAKTAGKRRKAAEKQRKSAAGALRQQRKAAGKSLAQQRKGLAQTRDDGLKVLRRRRRQVSKGASAASGAVAARGAEVTDTVAAAPAGVASAVRKARRSMTETLWDALTVVTAAGAYVMGARAGRERYEELAELGRSLAAKAAERPEVQAATQTVLDPEARSEAVRTVREQGRQRLAQVTGEGQ